MLFNLFLSFPIALLLIRFLMDIQSLVVDSDIGGAIIGRSEIDVIADYCNKFQQQNTAAFNVTSQFMLICNNFLLLKMVMLILE